jgi:ribosomal protein S18 acetylase RimI-like enzyme
MEFNNNKEEYQYENINTNKKKKKKTGRVFSEAHPPNKLGEREKIPSYSQIHKDISNLQINEDKIYYRQFTKDDIEEVKLLHKEWFPIDYDNDYFERIMKNDSEREYFTLGAMYRENEKEYILGAILCELRSETHLKSQIPNLTYKKYSISILTDILNFTPEYEYAYIMTIGVVDECRRMKLGTKLLNKAIEYYFNRKNCLGLYLHVVHYNQTAINFYRRNNFIECSTLKNYYKIKEEVYDSIVFVKFFNQMERKNSAVLDIFINFFKFIFFIITLGLFFKCIRRKSKLY